MTEQIAQKIEEECAYCGEVDCQHQRHTKQHFREIAAQAAVERGESHYYNVDAEGKRRSQVLVNNEDFLRDLLCASMNHPIALRRGDFKTLSCICGKWLKQVSHDDDGIISQVTVDALNEEIRQHRAIQHDLRTRVEWLIDQIGWSEEGCFTFPDGETWWKEPSE